MEKEIVIEENKEILEKNNKEDINNNEINNTINDTNDYEKFKKIINYTSIVFRVICALMPIVAIIIIYGFASPVAFTKHEMIGSMDYRVKDATTIMNICLIYCVFNLIVMIGVWSVGAYFKKKLKSFNDILLNNKEETTDTEIEEDIKESEIEIISKDMSKLYNQLVVKFILNFIFGAMLLIVNWKINIG